MSFSFLKEWISLKGKYKKDKFIKNDLKLKLKRSKVNMNQGKKIINVK